MPGLFGAFCGNTKCLGLRGVIGFGDDCRLAYVDPGLFTSMVKLRRIKVKFIAHNRKKTLTGVKDSGCFHYLKLV